MLGWVRNLGDKGEHAAERFLVGRGMKILARKWRTRSGELDLVALDGRQLVFVEVKTRREHGTGHPAESVGPAKQQKLTRLALQFLKQHKLLDCSCRFDVVAVTWAPDMAEPVIAHYANAFEATGRFQFYS